MKEIKLKDLVDVVVLQKIQDSFSNVTGMAVVTVDENGALTKISNSNEFCSKFNKNSAFGGGRDIDINAGRATTYTLPSGLTEFAAPIIVSGTQVGAIIGGLVLTEKLDDAKETKISSAMNIDKNEFSSAIKKIKVVTKTQVEEAANLLFDIATLIASTAKKETYKASSITFETTAELKDVVAELHRKVTEVNDLLEENSTNNKKLFESIVSLRNLADDSVNKVEDTKDTVKVIQDIAMNTRILGFNASIEASRAKESGKGFGVIAQEVRSLADVSKSSADKIEDIIQAIGTDSDEISQSVKKTEDAVNKNIQNANNISELLKEISVIAQQLK